jgi:hypothetical protein
MSNVNSEDPGGPIESGGGAGDGGSRVVQQREEVSGRRGWRLVGTLVATVFLLIAPVWLVAELLRVTQVVRDSGIRWLYASVLVLVLAAAVWFLFQILRRGTGSAK